MSKKLLDLCPQMRDYNQQSIAGLLWVPFIMYHCGFPGADTPSCSIDKFGCRYGTDRNGSAVSFAALADGALIDERVGIVVGGSTAFGVGATNNSKTISSALSKKYGTTFINMGMRSWVFRQNLVQWLFLRSQLPTQQNIGHLVIFSGYNELNCLKVGRFSTRTFGPIYGWSKFFTQANDRFRSAEGDLEFPAAIDNTVFKVDTDETARIILKDIWRAALSSFVTLTASFGAHIHFVLEPVHAWIDRELPIEEVELLDERMQEVPIERKIFAQEKDHYQYWYRDDLAQACCDNGITFHDANDYLAHRAKPGDWLFVDPWHMTDLGYDIISDLVAEVIGGKPCVNDKTVR